MQIYEYVDNIRSLSLVSKRYRYYAKEACKRNFVRAEKFLQEFPTLLKIFKKMSKVKLTSNPILQHIKIYNFFRKEKNKPGNFYDYLQKNDAKNQKIKFPHLQPTLTRLIQSITELQSRIISIMDVYKNFNVIRWNNSGEITIFSARTLFAKSEIKELRLLHHRIKALPEILISTIPNLKKIHLTSASSLEITDLFFTNMKQLESLTILPIDFEKLKLEYQNWVNQHRNFRQDTFLSTFINSELYEYDRRRKEDRHLTSFQGCLQELPKSIRNCTNLVHLDLEKNSLTELPSLDTLKSLQTLNVSHNSFLKKGRFNRSFLLKRTQCRKV